MEKILNNEKEKLNKLIEERDNTSNSEYRDELNNKINSQKQLINQGEEILNDMKNQLDNINEMFNEIIDNLNQTNTNEDN